MSSFGFFRDVLFSTLVYFSGRYYLLVFAVLVGVHAVMVICRHGVDLRAEVKTKLGQDLSNQWIWTAFIAVDMFELLMPYFATAWIMSKTSIEAFSLPVQIVCVSVLIGIFQMAIRVLRPKKTQ